MADARGRPARRGVGRVVYQNIKRLLEEKGVWAGDGQLAEDAGLKNRSAFGKWKSGSSDPGIRPLLSIGAKHNVRVDRMLVGADSAYDAVLGVKIAETATPSNALADGVSRATQNPPTLHGTSAVPPLTHPPLAENEGALVPAAAEGDVVEQARNRFLKFVESLETVEEVRAAHRAAKLASADIARGGLHQEGTDDGDS
jgi:hypothetical protein